MSDPLTTKPFREHERNKYVYDELTSEELALKEAVKQARLDQQRAIATLDELRKSCTHSIKYDISGFPYDSRHCAVCELHLETI